MLPIDYKEFISKHGLLSVHFGDAQSESNQMLDMKTIISHTLDLRDELVYNGDFSEKIAENIFPFQYLMDDNLDEYFAFRLNPKTNEFYVHDLDEEWDNLNDNKYKYALSFTEHIKKFVVSTIEEAKSYEE